MSIDTCITSSTSKVLVLTVWDVEMSFWVTVFLGQTEINDIDLVATFPNAHQEVVRFDVAVNERFGVNVLDTRDELIRQKQNGLQGEFAIAKVEQIFQAGSEKIKHHSIVVTFGAEPTNEGNPNASSKRLVYASLIFELRVLGLDTLEFDGNLLAGDDISA
jgi:hypothetical protein